MKLFFSFLLFAFGMKSYSQNSFIVSLNGISDFKIGMKKEQVEKLLNKPLSLHKLLKEEWQMDTLECTYKDENFSLVFDKGYTEADQNDFVLREVMTSSTAAKTVSGITIGDDKLKIINTYEGYTIWIVPDYENDFTTRSKTKSSVFLFGDQVSNVIVFHMNMNKIESFSVSYNDNYD